MRRKISITQKHFIYFLLLYFLSILLVGSYSYYIAKNSILERTFNQLTSVRVEKTHNIEVFFKDRKREIVLTANTKEIRNMLDLINNKNKLNISLAYLKAILNSSEYFSRILLINNSDKCLLIDKSKINEYLIFNLNKQFLDSNHVDSLRIRIQNTKKVCVQDYIPLNDSNLVFYIGAPIYDTFEQVMRGIIIFELPILQINKIMNTDNDKNGLGKTGEAYIVGNDFLLRTSSRFKENSIKSVTVKTTATINAFSNKVGVSLMKDYRNIEVLSSYSPLNISGLKWAILAEMDREEALQQIYDLRNSIVILCIIVSIFIFGLVYLGSMKLTTPIILLKDAATKISEGKYNVRVNLKSNDEMGELITSFNNMAEQLSLQSEQIVKDKLLRISSVIDAQEQERQRLSRDLHDGLGQMLLAVKIKLEQLKNYDIEKLKINMSDALELLKNSISEIRTISNDLTPTVLANFGLEDSIKKLCRDCLGTANITFDLKCEGLATVKLNAKKQIYIFRIIQEIINNITKHSAASSVQISIFTLNDMIEFNISDNGKGFDLNYTNKGNGLNNIMERCELMNGICNIESNENHGTSFRITIPTI